jgi:hypothetical protein
MIIDKNALFSDAQVLTSTGVSTNSFDAGNPATRGQIGAGHPLFAVVTLPSAPDFTTGDETYKAQLITSTSASLTSPTVLAERAFPVAAIPAGTRVAMGVPQDGVKRYLGMNYVLGGTTPTLTVTAFLTDEVPNEAPGNSSAYSSAVNQPV